ncbi:hypothetical protein EYF80_040439 [Liparis tanakae]|uniref:Uncharacterized protein n=1 Tax=Liparis tanakae TaxID=230148 RepID=A0A4Z2G765_9TELE|nr:hypothetical protein EYF80_040439 [Liparis tanakae]
MPTGHEREDGAARPTEEGPRRDRQLHLSLKRGDSGFDHRMPEEGTGPMFTTVGVAPVGVTAPSLNVLTDVFDDADRIHGKA